MPEFTNHIPGDAAGVTTTWHYRAFISYSHADTKWANWLIRRLEGYRVPERLRGRIAPIGKIGPRIAPVFRDRDELPTTSDLGEAVRTALRDSATLVVICSPASAKSHWVQEEILEFKRLHGETAVFAFIVAGEPKLAGASDDCFPPALRAKLGPDGQLSTTPAEHVGADARPQGDGREDAFVRLVAGLLGVGFDDLRQRELQRRHRRMTWIAVGAVTGMAVTLGLAAAAWQARNDAQLARNDAQRRQDQAEDLVSFMLGELWSQLERVGRLDVLDATGDKSMAYFAALNPRDLTDTMLAQQAKALTQIGRTRVSQARDPEALRAFSSAYDRAVVLATRHPENGEMLFERAQAEYWIGYVHSNRRDLPEARKWYTRYRDTAVALIALDPSALKGQGELAWGQHNLATLEYDSANLVRAREGFEVELTILNRLWASAPADLDLQYRMADAYSWLGGIAERVGNLGEALARRGDFVRHLERIVQADPGTVTWRARLADALALQASVLAITGRRAESFSTRIRARELIDALAKSDPQNQEWLLRSHGLRVKEVRLVRADGDLVRARQLVDEATDGLEKQAAAAPTNLSIKDWLGTAWRLRAELLDAAGEPGAAAAAARSVELAEGNVAAGPTNENHVAVLAQAHVTAGQIAAHARDHAAAQRHGKRALDLVEGRLAQSSHWRILDPAARALALLGDAERQRVIVDRLNRIGYQPLEPWLQIGSP